LILVLKRMFNMTLLVVTHELASAFRIADRIAMLRDGSVIAVDRREEFRASTNPHVRHFLDRVPERIVDGAAFQEHLRQLSGWTGAAA
jgi:phospholipid/cholesterol/gamma-HCH transport system ATP-binding protein